MEYLITNNKDIRDHFEKDFLNVTDAKNWITKPFRFIQRMDNHQSNKQSKKEN